LCFTVSSSVCCNAGSHDRSIRRWERTSEPFFVEEEKERQLESLFEADLEQQQQRAQREAGGLVLGPEGGSFAGAAAAGGDADADAAAAAGRRTIESVSAADAIIDALDVAAHEAEKIEEYERELRAAQVCRVQGLGRPQLWGSGFVAGACGLGYVLGVATSGLCSCCVCPPCWLPHPLPASCCQLPLIVQ
jgi:U3 small nucleolar RNA-associated protein 12